MNLLGTGMIVAGVPLTWSLAERDRSPSASPWPSRVARIIAGLSLALFIAGRFLTVG